MNGGLRSLLIWIDAKIGWGRIGFLLKSQHHRHRRCHPLPDAARDQFRGRHRRGRGGREARRRSRRRLFVAAGYFTLTFYDLFALRTIGRNDVSYRTAALAGFTSYSVGHNIGASAVTRGCRALPGLFRAWRQHDRGGENLFRCRAYVLARQCNRAGPGNFLCAGSGKLDRPASGLVQSAARRCGHRRSGQLRDLGVAASARDRPQQLAGDAARRAADPASDRHRHRRSRVLRGGDVSVAARRAAYRFHHAFGHLRLGDACLDLRAIRRAAWVCSMPPCWSRCGNSTARICSPDCCCSACSTISCRLRSRSPFSAAASCGSALLRRGLRSAAMTAPTRLTTDLARELTTKRHRTVIAAPSKRCHVFARRCVDAAVDLAMPISGRFARSMNGA